MVLLARIIDNLNAKYCHQVVYLFPLGSSPAPKTWARTVVGQKSHITDHALHWIFHLCKLTEFNNLSDDAYQLHCMEA